MIRKKIFAVFLRYKMSIVQELINADELYYLLNQFIWASANWYSNFHIFFMYHALHFPLCVMCFHSVISMYPFIICTRKQTVLTKRLLFFFHKRLTIHNFNVQTAKAEKKKKEQHTLSNITSIQFEGCDFFLWGLLWSRGSLDVDKLLEKYQQCSWFLQLYRRCIP